MFWLRNKKKHFLLRTLDYRYVMINHLAEEEIAGCLALLVFLMLSGCCCCVSFPLGHVSLVDL